MNRKSALAAACMLLTAGGAIAQEEKPPAAGATAGSSAQTQAGASAESGQESASVEQGTEIHATLSKPVDAGKSRPGDTVEARAAKDIRANGTVVVPRGSRLLGRVTRAKPRKSGGDSNRESPSALGIVFDRAMLKDGREVALNGTIAAVGAARTAGAGRTTTGGSGGGGIAGNVGSAAGGLAGTVGGTASGVAGVTGGTTRAVGSTVGGTASVASRSAGAVGGFDAAGSLKSESRGVFGLRDLVLATDATAGTGGSVITSAERTVQLEAGTQLLLIAGATAEESAQPVEPPMREPADRR